MINKNFLSLYAITPENFKKVQFDHKIIYGFNYTIFGLCLLALEDVKICHLTFGDDKENMLRDLINQWKGANFYENYISIKPIFEEIFNPHLSSFSPSHKILVKGTSFQVKVWEALFKIPYGNICCYEDIALLVNMPKAIRAVGNAIGKNNIAFLIPCHRVIKKSGELHKYRWDSKRKKLILEWEKQHYTFLSA